jgi:pimeloyl-ACP methyl ester carboxylesterase
VFDKLMEMWRSDLGVSLAELAGVSVPTLFLVGDDDIVSLEHAAAVYRALPDAQLAVIPGASHPSPMEKPHIVNRLILDFLADEQVSKLMPIGSAFTHSSG